MRLKRIVLMTLLVLLTTAPIFAGGAVEEEGKAAEEAAAAEKVPIRYLTIDSQRYPGADAVEDAVNKKMAADGVNLEWSVTFIPRDVWDDKINLKLSTGEEFELFVVRENVLGSDVYAGRGAIVPLDGYINQYGSAIKEHIPDYVLDAARVEGKIYSVPALWRVETDSGGEHGHFTVRTDLLKKYGLEMPKTADEFVQVAQKLQDNVLADTGDKIYIWMALDSPYVWLHRTYDSWPFYVDCTEEIFYVDQEGNVKAWIETEQFKKDCEFMRKLYTMGLIHPDRLGMPHSEAQRIARNGDFIYAMIAVGLGKYPSLKQKIPDIMIASPQLAPEKPNYQFNAYSNTNSVPTTTDHPEAGIRWLNWVYKNQENYELANYGIKGEHWKPIGEDRIEYILGPDGNELYYMSAVRFGNKDYIRYHKDDLDELIESLRVGDTTAIQANVLGFRFDSSPVEVEFANVMAEMDASIIPIKNGIVEYETHFEDALKNMKAAGLDKVIAEYEKQFKEWRATQ